MQKTQTDELTSANSIKQKDVEGRLERIEKERKLNVFEDNKSRMLSKINAARKTKLDFIEQQYDYTSQAKSMGIKHFEELMKSNSDVNNAMNPFTDKLDLLQKEIQ